MSQENVELVRGLVEQWNAGIRSVPTECFDPAVEFETPFSSVFGEPYRGYGGVRRWIRDIDDQFAEWRLRLDDVRGVDDAVIALGDVRGRGRASGIVLEFPVALITYFGCDQRIARVRICLDVNDALDEVGLRG